MTTLLRRSWDRLSLYLPVLLMGLLALGTWWLVRNAPVPLVPEAQRPVRHDPDYFMKGFSVKTFDGTGRLHSEIQGTMARHYPDTDTLEIDQARMRSVSPDGRVTSPCASPAARCCRALNSRASSCTPGPTTSACARTCP
jgi:lipopolysaccharide export system protein LptC